MQDRQLQYGQEAQGEFGLVQWRCRLRLRLANPLPFSVGSPAAASLQSAEKSPTAADEHSLRTHVGPILNSVPESHILAAGP
jgi:hypothetical protein